MRSVSFEEFNIVAPLLKKINKYRHLMCTFWISVAAVFVLIISFIVPTSPWSSILQNISAGLFTGIVVTLISSLKDKELKDAEIEDRFLQTVHDLYISSRRAYEEYRKARQEENDAYSEETYELIVELEAIEGFIESRDKDDRLVRILGKKPSQFFDECKDYSFSEQKERLCQLYDRLDSSLTHIEEERKTIDQQIEVIRRAHRAVNRKAMKRKDEIFGEMIEIETSVP